MTDLAVAEPVSLEGSLHTSVLPQGEPTDAQLALINRFARTPLTASQVYVFDMEISNDLYDSYSTRMDPGTTLPNYRDDYADGRALLNTHNSGELPLGSSFDARLESRGRDGDAQNPARNAVVASWFIQRGIKLNGVANDDVIRGIDGGTIRDGSVRFVDGDYLCDVCGQDMMRSFDCEHIPGINTKDGRRATATITNAHAIEGSLVFDGSTPRAMVDKAERLAERGVLTAKQVRSFEGLYHVRVRAKVPNAKRDDGERAEWDTKYMNQLPDSAFAYIAPGGAKDESGRTVPRSLRHFPHHDADGKPDEAHIRNALARIPQSDLSDAVKDKALAHVEAHAKSAGIDVADDDTKKSADRGAAGGNMTPEDFVDFITRSGMSDDAREKVGDVLVKSAGDSVDRAFVEAVAVGITKRVGKSISADTASKVQNALDHLSTAEDSHDAAKSALQGLITMGGMTEPDDINNVGQPDLNPANDTGKTSQGVDVTGLVNPDTLPKNGKINRDSGGGEGRATDSQSDGLGADVKTKLQQVHGILTDLLGDDEDDDSPGNDEDGDTTGKAGEEKGRTRAVLTVELNRPEHSALRKIVESARDGKRYRQTVVADLHEWGVRAKGAKYNRELFERMTPNMTTADVAVIAEDLRQEAVKRFANHAPGEIPEWAKNIGTGQVGRQTVPSANPYGPKAEGKSRAGVKSQETDMSAFTTKPPLARV